MEVLTDTGTLRRENNSCGRCNKFFLVAGKYLEEMTSMTDAVYFSGKRWKRTGATETLRRTGNEVCWREKQKDAKQVVMNAMTLREQIPVHAESLTYLSCPAVSQICNLIFFPPEIITNVCIIMQY